MNYQGLLRFTIAVWHKFKNYEETTTLYQNFVHMKIRKRSTPQSHSHFMGLESGVETFRINTLIPKTNLVSWNGINRKKIMSKCCIDKMLSCHCKLRKVERPLYKGCLWSLPAVTLAASRSLPMAADGTKVRSAALCRNSIKQQIHVILTKTWFQVR